MKKVFVSGCYDILHAGHIQFFNEARALGDYLIVSFASADVLWHHKKRRPSIPDDHKNVLLKSLRMVDEVVIGKGLEKGLDFEEDFRRIRPDFLVVTEDDLYACEKQRLCDETGAKYVVLPKTPPQFSPVSTSSLISKIKAPNEVPVRVDFAGGWLDVPRFAIEGAYVVNCAVTPMVSLRDWIYQKRAGLGGSGAWAMLEGRDPVQSELDLGVGWQDPAVIEETGLCVWKSGNYPVLDLKSTGEFLRGKMAIYYTGADHDTPGLANEARDYKRIAVSADVAREAVLTNDLKLLAQAVQLYYDEQMAEGMRPLPIVQGAIAQKYCGGGHGGYAVYIFESSGDREAALTHYPDMWPVEPYCRKQAE